MSCLFLTLFVSASVLIAALQATPTEYPLYSIVTGYYGGIKGSFSKQDLEVIATTFTAGQMAMNASAANLLHSYNAQFELLKYINTQMLKPTLAGEQNKVSVARFPFATLTHALSANMNDATIYLQSNMNMNPLPIQASTVSGDYTLSCKEYVSYIQIGAEFMKVLQIESRNNSAFVVTVVRGFIGVNDGRHSVITAHDSKSMVFAPAYTNFAPAMPQCTDDTNADQIHYAMNIQSAYAVQYLVNFTMDAVSTNANGDGTYNGSWFDNFSAGIFGALSMTGMKLKTDQLWNEQKNAFWNCNDFRIANQHRLTYVWRNLSALTNIERITIFANDMSGYAYWTCNTRALLIANSVPDFPKPLDGYSIESYALRDLGSCDNSTVELLAVGAWQSNVQEFMNATQSNLSAMPMIGDAGCHSWALEALPDKQYNQYIVFGYASFLLAIDSKQTRSRFGIPAMRQMNNARFAQVSDAFFWKIGNPIETKHQVQGYLMSGSNHFSYLRHFENGIVLVNPYSNMSDVNVNLNRSYFDPGNKNQEMQRNITLDAYSAYILLETLG